MDITAIYKDAITSALNDTLVPLRNDIKTLVAQQNDLNNTMGLLFILIAIMAVVIGILFYKLSKQRKRQEQQDTRVGYALKEIVRLSEMDAKQNENLTALSKKVEAQAAQYDRKFIVLGDHLDKAINKAVDDLNS